MAIPTFQSFLYPFLIQIKDNKKRKNGQLFQEKVNLFSKGVNDSSKMSTCSGKRLSNTSGKRAKTVNQNQEKDTG